jgi:hypothetical protein
MSTHTNYRLNLSKNSARTNPAPKKSERTSGRPPSRTFSVAIAVDHLYVAKAVSHARLS